MRTTDRRLEPRGEDLSNEVAAGSGAVLREKESREKLRCPRAREVARRLSSERPERRRTKNQRTRPCEIFGADSRERRSRSKRRQEARRSRRARLFVRARTRRWNKDRSGPQRIRANNRPAVRRSKK